MKKQQRTEQVRIEVGVNGSCEVFLKLPGPMSVVGFTAEEAEQLGKIMFAKAAEARARILDKKRK